MNELTRPQKQEDFDYTAAYRAGNGVYLAEGQTLEGVVAADRATLRQLGVTQEQVGSSLRQLLATWNDFVELRDPQPQCPFPGVVLSMQRYLLGQEWCPYVPGLYSSINWCVFTEGIANGNKAIHPIDGPTFVSDMMPEMIAKTGFFEGDVFFGVDPKWAALIRRMVELHQPQPYAPTFSQDAWDYVHKKISLQQAELELIQANHTNKVEMAPGVTAYVAPGEIAPWGFSQWDGGRPRRPAEEHSTIKTDAWAFFVNESGEDLKLQPDAALLGMPFDKNTTHISTGKSYGRYMKQRPAPKQIA